MNDLREPLPVAEAMKRRARAPRARPYTRLLWLIPGLALLAIGLYTHQDVEDDGVIHTVQLMTKPGVVGQASEALRLIQPGTPDFYLKIKSESGEERTITYKDTPIGNGLKWPLKSPLRMSQIKEIEVWDANRLRRDSFRDRVNVSGWSAEGQTYRIDLVGEPFRAPGWALPVAIVGGVIVLYAVLRFVWDQVI